MRKRNTVGDNDHRSGLVDSDITQALTDHAYPLASVSPEYIGDDLSPIGDAAAEVDLLDERINERLDAGETILNVIRALERADSPVESAADLRWIIIGIEEPSDVPDENEINGAIQLLSHPSLGVVERVEEGYQTVTNYENAVELLQSLDAVIQSVNEQEN